MRLIVPFAAGGNADFVARLCGEGMSQALGQPFVVGIDRRGRQLGAEMAARAAPEGYTLFTGSKGRSPSIVRAGEIQLRSAEGLRRDRACESRAASSRGDEAVPAKTWRS